VQDRCRCHQELHLNTISEECHQPLPDPSPLAPQGVIPVVRAYARFWQLPGGTEAVSRLVPENWYS